MLVKRSKKRFKSARAAWSDVYKKRNIPASRVKKACHTRTHYAWQVSEPKKRKKKTAPKKTTKKVSRTNTKNLRPKPKNKRSFGRKSFKGYCLQANVKQGRAVKKYYYDGECLNGIKSQAKVYKSESAALNAGTRIIPKLPREVLSIQVTRC